MRIPNLRNRLPPLGTLAAFEAACHHGSFTRAAAELNLTQAAVSRQIRSLEEHLGHALFERRRHDVVLTTAGRRFAEEVNPALNRIGKAATSLRKGQAIVTIAVEFCLAAHWLMPRLSRFQNAHPDLQLRILTSTNPTEGDEFDLAVAYGQVAGTRLQSKVLATDRIHAVCSPSYAARKPRPWHVDDISDAELIHFDQRGFDWMDWPGFLDKHGSSPRYPTRLSFGTYNNAVDAAMQGMGLVLGWSFAVRLPMLDGRLVSVSRLSVESPDALCVHVPTDRKLQEGARAFMEWLNVEAVT
ncbi:LysR substrate-binding domain-containing protein [Tabrizicola oligotrophica]|uniref:LysR family transcriptional regulator n=1 Tax=Tabrizicola oligotrophica TaxID=2710650 RepID=A0A6M0QYC5_9RHOB|nr:LysR substrate-binding domain-containing protein [Tabrizicola oligotrophica]NEY91784.1 LysR family transcriptional regulator [Tabrizicola oligotrophica]